ncbi:MAG: hypothetical protein HF982_15130 [Desulfobacteraceae bacterium]|nr:hypothetical protein [Desulfobacteraceae bacterium]MBC2720889.1 hypothetical protein [Desulfobacteraceae bacterium]
MKECIYCQHIIDDSLMECPKCKKSWFHHSTTPSKYSNNPEELIEYAIQKSGVKFTQNQKNDFKQTILDACKKNRIPVTQKTTDDFIIHLARYQ